jgi:hypothetical protein
VRTTLVTGLSLQFPRGEAGFKEENRADTDDTRSAGRQNQLPTLPNGDGRDQVDRVEVRSGVRAHVLSSVCAYYSTK